jgi:hypothetical protein
LPEPVRGRSAFGSCSCRHPEEAYRNESSPDYLRDLVSERHWGSLAAALLFTWVISRKVRSALAINSTLTGTQSQIEWAETIRVNVDREFDRVASVFEAQATRQTELDQADTRAIIAILEAKRTETFANERAGYFIRDWQELNDQVRQMIAKDPGYQAIKTNRAARRSNIQENWRPTTS